SSTVDIPLGVNVKHHTNEDEQLLDLLLYRQLSILSINTPYILKWTTMIFERLLILKFLHFFISSQYYKLPSYSLSLTLDNATSF
ncbi:hypothetical protein S245_030006, partial [Arachis hypogaea]